MKLTRGQKFLFCFLVCLLTAGAVYFFFDVRQARNLNVVLITIDDLRADHLGCYGYKRDTSPHIDALAREGALFTQAIAQSSQTPSSLGVIATSTYPPTNQLRRFGDTLAARIPTLAEILKAHGYRTIFAGGNDHFRNSFHGFDRGFDAFYNEHSAASLLTQKASALVGQDLSKPFFLWVHYMDVHGYTPAGEFENLFVNDKFYDREKKLPIVKSVAGQYGRNGISEFRAGERDGIDNPDYYIALYDGAIRSVDQQIGLLLKKLALVGGKRKTLVIITADHGEMLGEHGYYFHHGAFLYEPLIKVPFILRGPAFPAGRIDTQISAGLEVLPAILDALKIKKHSVVQGRGLPPRLIKSGRSPSYVISDVGYGKKSVRAGEWKLIYSRGKQGAPGQYALFNLKEDPGETKDLVSVERVRFEVLKEKLDAYCRKFAGAKPSPPTLNEEAREGLKALGYLQ